MSGTGSTRTAPAPDARLSDLRVGVVNCQDWQNGYRRRTPILPTRSSTSSLTSATTSTSTTRPVCIPTASTTRPKCWDWTSCGLPPTTGIGRRKSDPAIQRAHGRFPLVLTWDDHEVENNYATFIDEINVGSCRSISRVSGELLSGLRRAHAHPPAARPDSPQTLLVQRPQRGSRRPGIEDRRRGVRCHSISSDFPIDIDRVIKAANPSLNPQVKYFDGSGRGYLRMTIDRSQWLTEARTVPTIAAREPAEHRCLRHRGREPRALAGLSTRAPGAYPDGARGCGRFGRHGWRIR